MDTHLLVGLQEMKVKLRDEYVAWGGAPSKVLFIFFLTCILLVSHVYLTCVKLVS